MNIKELCYELYKVDWMTRISSDRIADSLKDFYAESSENGSVTYDEYITENGYDGELYACYDEFLDSEYTDEQYMRELLDDQRLFSEYQQDTGISLTENADDPLTITMC